MKRIILLCVVLAVAAPAAVFAAQRFARERGAQRGFGDGVTPSQVWRVRTLTMDQRLKLSEMQSSLMRDLRDARGDGAGRREMAGALVEAQRRMATVVTPVQLDLARQQPRGPLAPEEILYYGIVALPDLAVAVEGADGGGRVLGAGPGRARQREGSESGPGFREALRHGCGSVGADGDPPERAR